MIWWNFLENKWDMNFKGIRWIICIKLAYLKWMGNIYIDKLEYRLLAKGKVNKLVTELEKKIWCMESSKMPFLKIIYIH